MKFLNSAALTCLFFTRLALATDAIPPCEVHSSLLPIDNANALHLEKTTANQYTTQAHVEGLITTVYPNRNGHNHFAIQLGDDASQGIEVVYSIAFGALPQLTPGMKVEACGEFINSDAPTSQYPASPMGAIIHWVHTNLKQGANAHPSGFIVIDGALFGEKVGKSSPNGG